MEPFLRHSGIAAAMPLSDINTDVIYPQRYLRRTNLKKMGAYLFHGLRFNEDGHPNPNFVLNRQPWDQASILVAGQNFGSGSSREHAPWALGAFGFRCIISPLFADIFKSNCINNGILPATISESDAGRCLEAAANPETCHFTVDLDRQEIANKALGTLRFDIETQDRRRLMEGFDSIDETLSYETHIAAHEATVRSDEPWLNLDYREA
jgi:3-isopropylmalate/(R)-2-methylmalate dehydratase small subunit